MFLFGGGGRNSSNNKNTQNDEGLGKSLRNKIVNIINLIIMIILSHFRPKIC